MKLLIRNNIGSHHHFISVLLLILKKTLEPHLGVPQLRTQEDNAPVAAWTVLQAVRHWYQRQAVFCGWWQRLILISISVYFTTENLKVTCTHT